MSCETPWEIREEFPDIYRIVFFSSAEDTAEGNTDTHIASTNVGYLTELETLGQSKTAPGSKARVAAPYPTLLRPVNSNIHRIIAARKGWLESLEYIAYDPTLAAAAPQTAAVLTAIYNSKATDDAYMQSFYRNGMLPNFQPNFLRPSFIINGKNYFPGFEESHYGNGNNLGDISIGIPLNKCWPIQKRISKITDVNAYGQVAQIIDNAGTPFFQRYALMLIAEFWIGRGNANR